MIQPSSVTRQLADGALLTIHPSLSSLLAASVISAERSMSFLRLAFFALRPPAVPDRRRSTISRVFEFREPREDGEPSLRNAGNSAVAARRGVPLRVTFRLCVNPGPASSEPSTQKNPFSSLCSGGTGAERASLRSVGGVAFSEGKW